MSFQLFINQKFRHIDGLKNKWIYILSSTLFAHFFLIVFQPYGLHEEMNNPINSGISKFLFFFSVALSTFIGLSLSQFFFRKLFDFQNVTIKKYSIWYFVEALIVTAISFGFSFIIPDLGNDFEKELNLAFQIENYFKALVILLFPFFGTITYILYKELSSEVKQMDAQLKAYQNNYKLLHTQQKDQLLELKDENDNLDISIVLKDFLFAEASNQYILIYYLKSGLLKKHIIRNRLKNFLNETNKLPIKQSHRSYAVNLLNVEQIVRINGKEFLKMITLDTQQVPISKSYLKNIKQEVSKEK